MKLRLEVRRNTEARAEIEKLKNARTFVGWFGDTKYDDSTSVSRVASWQEFGTANIPARPFMRPARNKNFNKWTNILKHNLQTTHNVSQSLDALAMVVEGDIRQAIVDVTQPPLSPATIKARMERYTMPKFSSKLSDKELKEKKQQWIQKRFTDSITKPLIDTGLMISSVSHKTEAK